MTINDNLKLNLFTFLIGMSNIEKIHFFAHFQYTDFNLYLNKSTSDHYAPKYGTNS